MRFSLFHRRWTNETRLCAILFGAALLGNIALSSIGWGHNLLGRHEFRQVQTAITTHFFLTDGVKLNYETPLLGPPWQIPLELPLFQACVTWFVQATGLPLDLAGTLMGWLFFLSALPACFLLLGRWQITLGRRLIFLSLLILSPIYIFFSRAFLIESTVLSLSCWFLYFFGRYLDSGRGGYIFAATCCGAIGGMVKVTTFAVFLVAALLLLINSLRTKGGPGATRLWFRAGLAVAGPLLASVWWVFRTASIRSQNPEAFFLESHFGYWSFGDVALRLSPRFWLTTFRVWSDEIVSEAALAFIVLYFGWLRGRYRWAVTGCLIAFLSGQLIFANLYFVHDYYFYGSGLFLVAAVGFGLLELLDQAAIPLAARWAFLTTVVAFQANAYHRSLFEFQNAETSVPEYAEFLNIITQPDDVIIALGYDWDGAIPYYAGRRALMLVNGRQYAPEGIKASVARLDRKKVGAVLIRGEQWQDATLVGKAFDALDLGGRPLFFNQGMKIGIWIPEERQSLLRDQIDQRRFSSIQVAFEQNVAGKPKTAHARQLAQRVEFADFNPRPIRFTALNDFTNATIDGITVLNAHATSELVFRLRGGIRNLTGIYGLPAEAFARPGMTDGVEFVVQYVRTDGSEENLFRRMLDPDRNPDDRGIQHLNLALPENAVGELVLRTLPGPTDNAAFDWSYWGQLKLQ